MRTRFAIAILVVAVSAGVTACDLGSPTTSATASDPSASGAGASDALPGPAFDMWTRVDLPTTPPLTMGGNRIAGLVRFNGELIAVGGVNPGCCDGGFSLQTRALVWRTIDGTAWTLDPAARSLALGGMHAVATDGTRLVAIGSVDRDSAASPGQAEHVGAAWISTDGTTWDVVPSVTEFADIAATAGGFVAVALDGGPAIWRSADGQTWAQVAGPEALGNGLINRIASTGDGFIAVGESAGHAAVWRSPDGTAWSRAEDQASLREGWMRDVAGHDGRYVAVGGTSDREVGQVWASDDGTSWDRVDDAGWASGGELWHVLDTGAAFLAVDARRSLDQLRLGAWVSLDGRAWHLVPSQPAFGGGVFELKAWVAGSEDLAVVAVGSRADVEPVPVAWTIR
jgi:hypothetical protein